MVIWMANLIRLPARQSNSICETALTVSKRIRRTRHCLTRLAEALPITRLQQDCVNGFNRRCEKRWSHNQCEMLGEMFSRCSQEGSQGRGPFFLEPPGIGSRLLRPSFWPQLSVGIYSLDCNDLGPINYWQWSSSAVMCVR